jgi:dipeptidyl aminopeptidase/acylaminoacyl peptidase
MHKRGFGLRPGKAKCGSWKSPITTDLIVSETIRLGQIFVQDGKIYWHESRPSERGRGVIIHYDEEERRCNEVVPKNCDVRTRVHEYGGGAFTVFGDDVFFSNDKDQLPYVSRDLHNMTLLLEPAMAARQPLLRFADYHFDHRRARLICILEDHSVEAEEERNSLVAIDIATGDVSELAGGNDFYASPAISPDGETLAFLTWNHPNMPWDGCELWVAEMNQSGQLQRERKIAGSREESIFQPQWSPDGTLFFVSDKTNWWNLYRWADGKKEHTLSRPADFGFPQWVFGMSTYAFESDKRLVCTFFEDGAWHLAALELDTGKLVNLGLPFTEFSQIRASEGQAVFLAGSPIAPNSVVRYDFENEEFEILRKSADIQVETTFISRPEKIEFPTEGNRTAFGYFYPPQNRDFEPARNERPPLIVKSHGGPTGMTSTSLDWRIQFFTSRGFSVLDVNYGGSSGYGRAYRERLTGKWGITDVDDCVNGAKYLIRSNRVNPDKIAIAGGSAGGYTTLCALTFHDFFKAGASYYGISDLEAMAVDTHKFESRYLDKLIAPYPDGKDIYHERSPLHFTERLSCPVILLQGLEDKVVTPNQAEMMVESLRAKGIPVAYVPFEGEQHGFRQSGNIKRALEAELYFYSRIFRFDLKEQVEPVEIYNL